ncbi:hypothetical protein [uncultured Neglectibacter sp.]|uniref:hypothetical protein n=1 Tax=uncultured Neglectibacter sp. TaxID=1924108 RepID=UPI0034DE86B9
MSDSKQMPVTAALDEAASRQQLESQLSRLSQEIGAKSKITIGFKLNDGDIASESQRLSKALQASVEKTSLKVSDIQVDKKATDGFSKIIKGIGEQASSSLKKSIGDAGRRYMPAAFQW